MATRDEVIQSDWIRATRDGRINVPGMGDAAVLTISRHPVEWADFPDGKRQRVIQFNEIPGKKLGLNAVNWDTIAQITGQTDDDNWAGHKIMLFVIPEPRSQQTGHALRVRRPMAGMVQSMSPAQIKTAFEPPTMGENPPVEDPLGESNAKNMTDKLASTGGTIDALRVHLTDVCGKSAANVALPPAMWPKAWALEIQAYLRKPPPQPAKPEEIKASDIPF